MEKKWTENSTPRRIWHMRYIEKLYILHGSTGTRTQVQIIRPDEYSLHTLTFKNHNIDIDKATWIVIFFFKITPDGKWRHRRNAFKMPIHYMWRDPHVVWRMEVGKVFHIKIVKIKKSEHYFFWTLTLQIFLKNHEHENVLILAMRQCVFNLEIELKVRAKNF